MAYKTPLPESPHASVSSQSSVGLVQLQGINKNHWVPSRFNARATNGDGSVIIWNTYTGAMNVFEAKDRPGIDNLLRSRRGFTGELKGLAKYLYERGYLISGDTNEYRRFQLMAGQQQYRTDILELILLASEDCNFRCVYCYEDFPRGTMEPSVRQAIKKYVEKRAGSLKQLGIKWFGGEPLYGFSAIEELAPFFVDIAEEYSLTFGSHMTTNGYLLTPDVADKLLQWKINDFQITLDGLAEQHDAKRPTRDGCKTFDTIYSNLQSLQKRSDQFWVNIRVNFDQENHHELESLLELLARDFSGDERFSLGFHTVKKWGGPNDSSLSVCGVTEARAATDQLQQSALDKNLKIGTLQEDTKPGRHVCYAARPYNFIIGADGTLMKCTVVLGSKDYNIVGRITDDGEMELDLNNYSLWTEPAFEGDSHCQKCFMLPSCQGMYCPWVRIEEDTQPCPSTKKNIRRELLTTLDVSEINASARKLQSVTEPAPQPAQHNGNKSNGVASRSDASDETVDFGCDEAWIKSLTADELINHSGNFYPYYYLNLLSILGDSLPVDQIQNIAVESTRKTLLNVREYLLSLSTLPDIARLRDSGGQTESEQALIKLQGWDIDLIRSLLQRGKGLIFCSHHIGSFMSLPQELALMGFKVSLVIDEITFNQSYPRLEFVKKQLGNKSGNAELSEGNSAPENIHRLNILNAQDKESFVSLIKALERGECIFVYVDGNTGWDGIWGSTSKSAIDFLGFPITVKHGIPRLAAASGAPILPLVTLNDEGSGKLIFGTPIIPRPDMTSQERDEFVTQSMKAIYKLLEDHALSHIDQWSSVCFLHRWRVPSSQNGAAAPTSVDLEEIERLLQSGNRFKVKESRVATVNVKDATTLIDVQTLKIYKAPEEAQELFRHLLHKDGLMDADVSAINGGFEGRRKIVTLLAHLKKLDVIVSS